MNIIEGGFHSTKIQFANAFVAQSAIGLPVIKMEIILCCLGISAVFEIGDGTQIFHPAVTGELIAQTTFKF